MSAFAAPPADLLRDRRDERVEVRPFELFFDLVYVLAVTQLTDQLLNHLSVRGAAETLLLLLAVWWAWVDTAWFTNWFDPDHAAVRIVVIGLMLASLIMSAFLPEAFGERGLAVAGMYAAMQVGRAGFAVLTLAAGTDLRRNFQRILAWRSLGALVWLAGGLADGGTRDLLWIAGAGIDLAAPALAFPVPGLGRSSTHDWTIAGGHLAERCQLFVILALGESIVVEGSNFGELPINARTVAAFAVAFVGSVALWWIYFDRASELGRRRIERDGDPGRLGRSAYTYFHLPMVAGVIVAAAADEVTIAHPGREVTAATAALILGGPLLYVAGTVLFKWAIFGVVSRPRVLVAAALAALAAVGPVVSAGTLSAAATALLVGLAGWDARTVRRAPIEPGGEAALGPKATVD